MTTNRGRVLATNPLLRIYVCRGWGPSVWKCRNQGHGGKSGVNRCVWQTRTVEAQPGCEAGGRTAEGGGSRCETRSIGDPRVIGPWVRSKRCLLSPLFEVTSAQTTLRMGSPCASGSNSKDRGLRSGVGLPSVVSLRL